MNATTEKQLEKLRVDRDALYRERNEWAEVLRAVNQLMKRQVVRQSVGHQLTELARVNVEPINFKIRQLNAMETGLRQQARQPSFARHAEGALVMDNEGRLNVAGLEVEDADTELGNAGRSWR